MMHNQTNFLIERIETDTSKGFHACYFASEVYDTLNERLDWQPLERLLVDSDQLQLIYVLELDGEWVHVRFPLPMWQQLDHILYQEEELRLVVRTIVAYEGDGHDPKQESIALKGFVREGHEIVANMHANANYGQDVLDNVDRHFPQMIAKLTRGI